jgi:hypothetical protein
MANTRTPCSATPVKLPWHQTLRFLAGMACLLAMAAATASRAELRQQYVGSTGNPAVINSQGTSYNSTANPVTVSFTHVTAAAVAGVTPPGNTILLVAVELNSSNDDARTVGSVTYVTPGPVTQNLSLVTGGAVSGGSSSRLELWCVANPVAATGTVNVSIPNANARTVSVIAAARTFEGVSLAATPLGTAGSNTATSAAPATPAIAVQPGQMVFGGGTGVTNTLINVQNPAAQFIEWHTAGAGAQPILGWGSVRATLTETSVTLGATLNASTTWIMVGVPILAAADVIPSLTVGSQAVPPGTAGVAFTAQVANRGDDAAAGVQLTVTFPTGWTPTAAAGCTISSLTVTCPTVAAALAARTTNTYTITATAPSATNLGLQTVTASAVTSTSQVTANDTTSEVVSVQGASDGSGACSRAGAAGGTITGVVNTYYPGTASASAGSRSLSLGTPTGLTTVGIAAGDRLLVIQMQGASIDYDNDSRYGDGVQGGFASGAKSLSGVGVYEFVTATSALAAGASGSVSIVGNGSSSGLLNSYTNADATSSAGQSRFQVVRVPQYTTVTLGGAAAANAVTASPWTTTTTAPIGLGSGGIVAIEASGAMTLNAYSVDVSGQGFRGGGGFVTLGPVTNPEEYVFPASSNANDNTNTTERDGVKGEGVAGTPKWVYVSETGAPASRSVNTGQDGYPSGSLGRGAPGNAGGGGTDTLTANQWNTGGGGGGNGGYGGWGGLSWNDHRPVGGSGGSPVPADSGRLFMGGGGGSGSANTTPVDLANAGARGGGIVILTARTINAAVANRRIYANGGSAAAINGTNGSVSDGAGGGGAGGSVLVRVSGGAVPANMTIQAIGGAGGLAWPTSAATTTWPQYKHGPGGGGGGGIILYQGTGGAPTTSVAAGTYGTSNTVADPYGAQAGYVGVVSTFAGNLNGICATCAADPAAVSITPASPNLLQNSNQNFVVNFSNAAYVTSTSGTTTIQITFPSSPVALTPGTATGTGWTCSTAGQVVTCTTTAIVAHEAAFNSITIPVHVGTYSSSAQETISAAITGWGTNYATFNDTTTDTVIILSPTVAHVAKGWAVPMPDGICVGWSTSFETSNLGFRVWRETAAGRALVSPDLVAGSALGVRGSMTLAQGKPYRILDRGSSDTTAKYWLEDVDLSGRSSWHGPFFVDAKVPSGQGCPKAPTLADLGHVPDDPLLGTRAQVAQAALGPGKGATVPTNTSHVLAGMSGVKIGVQESGWYRVTRSELLAAGLDISVQTANLRLLSEGIEYPILIETAPSGDGSQVAAVQFYGFGIDSPYTRTRVFWLVNGKQKGLRLSPRPVRNQSETPTSFAAVAERRDRTVYFSSLTTNGDAENFFGPLVSPSATTVALAVDHLITTGEIDPQLTVKLQGVTEVPHTVAVTLNGTPAATLTFTGRDAGSVTVPVPVELLNEGDNSVSLVGTAGSLDYSLVDTVGLLYPRGYVANNGALQFSVPAGQQALVTGLATDGTVLVDITSLDKISLVTPTFATGPDGPALVAPVPHDGPAIAVSTDHTFLAAAPEAFLSPLSIAKNQVPSWWSASNGANELIIAGSSMTGAAQQLLRFRQGTGSAVALVDIEDVFDEFSYGEKTPLAIQQMVARTRSWSTVPSYLLLIGDASFDPKNYLGLGDFDFVPTKLVATSYLKTASDDWFADLNGDAIPDIAVGRLPARSADEVNLLVAKTIAFEQASSSETWKQHLVFAADADQQDFSFSGLNRELQGLAGPGYTSDQIAVGDLGVGGARTELLASLNAGALVVNYSGHGSEQTWHDLLDGSDAASLSNGARLPVVTALTCLNGFFQDVNVDSLAESLLRAPNGGAVAVWASSALTEPTAQAAMARQFFTVAFGTNGARLGDAIRTAKAATISVDVRQSWVLLGDPMIRLK